MPSTAPAGLAVISRGLHTASLPVIDPRLNQCNSIAAPQPSLSAGAELTQPLRTGALVATPSYSRVSPELTESRVKSVACGRSACGRFCHSPKDETAWDSYDIGSSGMLP
jgi:hypothetical protein